MQAVSPATKGELGLVVAGRGLWGLAGCATFMAKAGEAFCLNRTLTFFFQSPRRNNGVVAHGSARNHDDDFLCTLSIVVKQLATREVDCLSDVGFAPCRMQSY